MLISHKLTRAKQICVLFNALASMDTEAEFICPLCRLRDTQTLEAPGRAIETAADVSSNASVASGRRFRARMTARHLLIRYLPVPSCLRMLGFR